MAQYIEKYNKREDFNFEIGISLFLDAADSHFLPLVFI